MHPYIAPLIFALAVIGILAGYLKTVLSFVIPLGLKLIIAVPLILLIAAMVYVLFKRKREIDKEDSDDLGKY